MFGLYPPRIQFADCSGLPVGLEPINHYTRPGLCMPRVTPGVVLEGGQHDELRRESLCAPSCLPPTVTRR